MASNEDRRLVAEFLGRSVADAWGPSRPEALLGLDPGQTDPPSVRAALSQRLMVLAFHPRAQSPDADRLRTLLEAAAHRLAPNDAMPHDAGDIVADIRVPDEAPTPPSDPSAVPSAEQSLDDQAHQIASLLGLDAPAHIDTFDGGSVPIDDQTSPDIAAQAPDDLGPIELDDSPNPARTQHTLEQAHAAQPLPTAHTSIPDGVLVLTGLERSAGALLSRTGGVTPTLLHELGLLALQRGLPVAVTEVALRNVAAIMAHPMIPVMDAPPGHWDQPRPTQITPSQIAPTTAAPRTSSSPTAFSPAPAFSSAPAPADLYSPSERRPEDVLLSRILLFGSIAVVIAVVAIVLLIIVTRGPATKPAPTPATAAAPNTTPDNSSATTRPADADPASRDRTGIVDAAAFIRQLTGARPDPGTRPEPAAVIARLRDAADQVATSTDSALTAFESAARSCKFWWVTFAPAERQACVNSIVDFILRMPDDPGVVRRAMAAITTRVTLEPAGSRSPAIDPGDVQPAIWSSGVLARLSRERDVPSTLRSEIQRAIAEMYPAEPLTTPDFTSGSSRALRAMPRRLLGMSTSPNAEPTAQADPGASSSTPAPSLPVNAPTDLAKKSLEKWIEALVALSPAARPGRAADEVLADPATQRELLDAAEVIMLARADVTTDPAAFDLLNELIARVRFRDGTPGQPRLVAWLADERMSTTNLAVVTRVVVNAPQSQSVGPAMVLAPTASTSERATVRDELVRSWSIAVGGTVSAVAELFAKVAAERLTQFAPPDAPPLNDLRLAVGLALINRAVYQRDRNQSDEAQESLKQEAPAPPTPGLLPTLADPSTSETWAVRYLGADRSLAVRLERLKELESAGISSRADGDVLAEVALLAPVPELRSAAQKLCIKFSDRIEVIDGLLKALPRAPRSRTVVDTVQRVTNRAVAPATSPRWMLDARRALVARALEVLARGDERTGPDALAADLAAAYQVCAGIESPGSTVQLDDAPAVALAAVEKLQRDLLAQARALVPNDAAPVRLDEIERRRAGRLMVATGPIQQFAAEQVTCAELVAFIVTARVPARAAEAKTIIDEMHAARNSAQHIFTQILACERAMTRLWLLYLQPREVQS